MPELNGHQFSAISPDQQALPGMEHLAHPWARHLAQGYAMRYSHDRDADYHVLHAVDSESPTAPFRETGPQERVHGELIWKGGTPDRRYAPGEITWVENVGRSATMPEATRQRSRGIAGALMQSAHYFDFDQDTVPLHSPSRTEHGDKFADKVMPELKPAGRQPFSQGHKAMWDSRPEHPYEVRERAESVARVKSVRKPRPPQRERIF